MQSMTPTTAGSAPHTAAQSRDKGDEITVIASSVAPSDKSGQKTGGSFSKSTGFSSQLSAKEVSEATADGGQEPGTESVSAYISHPHQNLGQAQFTAGHYEGTAGHGKAVAQSLDTLGQALNAASPQILGQAQSIAETLNKAPGTTTALNELATLSLTRQHRAVSQQATSAGQTGTGTVSTAPLSQQITSETSLATSFTSQLNEVLASKSEQIGITALNGTANDASHPAISQPQPTSQTTPARAVWANVQMDASPGKWGEQMLQVLQDRVSLQATQNLQEARIRLDPPDLGKLDLVVRVDGDRLNVQINANHGAVRDALVQVSERLRAELQQQQFVHVDVNVGTGDQGQAHDSRPQEDDSYQPVVLGANESADNTTDTTSEHWLSTTA